MSVLDGEMFDDVPEWVRPFDRRLRALGIHGGFGWMGHGTYERQHLFNILKYYKDLKAWA